MYGRKVFNRLVSSVCEKRPGHDGATAERAHPRQAEQSTGLPTTPTGSLSQAVHRPEHAGDVIISEGSRYAGVSDL